MTSPSLGTRHHVVLRYRAPEPTVLVIDGFSRNVMVVNQDFQVDSRD